MSLLINNARIIDPEQELVLENSWLLIEAGRIAAIGSQAPPAADQVLDASGLTLLPGLFNLHVHIQRRHLALKNRGGPFRAGAPAVENAPDTHRIVWAVKNAWRELAAGVTTLRDCGSKNRINIALRQLIADGLIQGPTVLACGFGIAATGGHETHRYQGAVEVDGPQAVRQATRAEIKAGADFIKLMASGGIGGMPEHEDPDWVELGSDELAASVREAHNRGKKTTVHAMGAASVIKALEAGIDCIEHGVNLTEEALDLMEEKAVAYVPTVSGIQAVAQREQAHGDPALAALMMRRVVDPLKDSIRKAATRKILIGCGTDTVGDVVTELGLLQACGLSLTGCLRAATSNASRICGLEQERGFLAVGQAADLLLLGKNPLENLEHLRCVEAVFKDGVHVDPHWLIQN